MGDGKLCYQPPVGRVLDEPALYSVLGHLAPHMFRAMSDPTLDRLANLAPSMDHKKKPATCRLDGHNRRHRHDGNGAVPRAVQDPADAPVVAGSGGRLSAALLRVVTDNRAPVARSGPPGP